MIVADTNLVSYLLIEGQRTAAARAVWARDPQWRLPTLWRSEFLNVLATLERAGGLTARQALDTWRKASRLFRSSEVEPSGEEVLRTAFRRKLSAYDAQFVVAAEVLDVPLVTSDGKILSSCPDRALALEAFAAGR